VPELDGKNYLNWRSIITGVICLKGYKDVIFKGTGDSTADIYARAFLKSYLDDEHFSTIRIYDTAKEIWDHLSRMCLGANSNDITLLARKFYKYVYSQRDSIPS